VFSTRELARGQAQKDLPAYRDDKELDDWIEEFILDQGMRLAGEIGTEGDDQSAYSSHSNPAAMALVMVAAGSSSFNAQT
jgi:hypothetical protein